MSLRNAVDIERDREARRHCMNAWPAAVAGEYDPRCCRFPKSCSCPPPETDGPHIDLTPLAGMKGDGGAGIPPRPGPNAQQPLTDNERLLIRAAESQIWDDWLRDLLKRAVELRGYRVGAVANCGDLVEILEADAR